MRPTLGLQSQLMELTIDAPRLLAYLWFAWVGAVTPGPNTMIALACGAHFGWRSIAGHLIGVVSGVSVMMVVVLAGAHAVIDEWPKAAAILRWLGVVWLLWLALQLGRSAELAPTQGPRVPSAWESALFQWANPKAWMVITGAAAAWRGIAEPAWLDALLLAGLFAASCALALLIWAGGGERLAGWLRTGRHLLWFNRFLALSLTGTAIWLAMS